MPVPVVIRSANLYLSTLAPPLTGTLYNLSCYATAVELMADTESVDIGTFCAPGGSEQGRTTYSAVASLLWSPGLYDLLLPAVGLSLWAKLVPSPVDQTQYVLFNTRFSALPWGRFEIGQRVEVDLPLAVLNTPTWEDTV